jgi:HEAT repeat protein
MVVVALGRMRNPAAVQILIELLGDEQVAGHAVKALRKLRAPAARERLVAMSNHPKTWIRNEVKKTLDAIEKEEAR